MVLLEKQRTFTYKNYTRTRTHIHEISHILVVCYCFCIITTKIYINWIHNSPVFIYLPQSKSKFNVIEIKIFKLLIGMNRHNLAKKIIKQSKLVFVEYELDRQKYSAYLIVNSNALTTELMCSKCVIFPLDF